MAQQPSFASIPYNSGATLNTANTARDGSGTLITIATAPASGLLIHDIRINAISNTSAGMLRFFLSNGTTNFLIMEHTVTTVSPSSTNPAWQSFFTDLNLVLQSGWSLKASSEKSEIFRVTVVRAGAL